MADPAPTPSAPPPRKRRGGLYALSLLALAAAAGIALWFGEDEEGKDPSAFAADREFAVVRGDFTITTPLSGTLDAVKRHNLSCNVPGREQLKIEKLVEEKTEVKSGQTVFVLSCDTYENDLDRYVTELENERKNLVLAEQDLEIQKSVNLSKLKSAKDALQTARESLDRYKEMDGPKKRKDILKAVEAAENRIERAKTAVSEAGEALREAEWRGDDEKEKARAELETAEKEQLDAQEALDKANHENRVFKQYEYPQKMRKLQEELFKARLDLRKALTESEANLIQAKRRIENHQTLIRKTTRAIKDLRENMKKLVLKAPVDGILAHGNPNRRPWQTPKEIEVGTLVRPREVIGSIPDLSSFIVEVDLPESHRSKVDVGMPATFHSPSVPELKMTGEVTEIAPTANNVIFWDKNSPKVYEVKIATDASDDRLSPGITVEVEIHTETVKNALYVPVEAVYQREGKTYCKVLSMGGAEERQVETGRSSTSYVEITSGLEEGERVLLARKGSGLGDGGQ